MAGTQTAFGRYSRPAASGQDVASASLAQQNGELLMACFCSIMTFAMIEERIQRNAFEVVSLSNVDDSNYWLSRSPIERIEAIEFMRKAMFGSDRVSERLQRILTVASVKGD